MTGWKDSVTFAKTTGIITLQQISLNLDYTTDPQGCYFGSFSIKDTTSGTGAPANAIGTTDGTGISVTICSLAYPLTKRTGCAADSNYL